MQSSRTLFFDLDGTLINSYEGVIRAYRYALDKMGAPPLSEQQGRAVLGPPLEFSFRELSGIVGAENARAIALYREYYEARGINECSPYPGIREMLSVLSQAGLRLCVATSKPELMARRILAEKELDGFFDFIGGAEMTGPRSDKESVLRYCLAETGASASSSLMIGDREHDMRGASALGIPGIGVLWGFGDERELLESGAIAVASSPAELARLLSDTGSARQGTKSFVERRSHRR